MRKLAVARSSQYPALRSVPQNRISTGASIPAPTWGWDTETNIAAMPADHAVELVNWFPTPSGVEIRRDKIRHCNTLTGEPVETLACWNGQAASKLFAISDGIIFDVTSAGIGSIQVSGLNTSRWQYINYATTGTTYLWMCSGVDDPRAYNGAAWVTPTLTIAGFTADQVVNVNSHKNRLWFCFVDSAQVGYLPVDSFQGNVSLLDLGPLLTQGGSIVAMGSWSIDAGDGLDDYAVFVGSDGNVIIYRGTDPDDATLWLLVGTFSLGKPIGRRCVLEVGPDLAIISIDGVLPLSKAMIFERAAVAKVTMTQRIQSAMNTAAKLYRDNFGWELISYPRGTRAILNVPITEGVEQEQFVMNTLNGAWCRFTGMNANTWSLFEGERLFYGANDGFVMEADVSGLERDEESFRADMRTAFHYYGLRGRQKFWNMCRPLLTTDAQVVPGLAFNVDYQEDAEINIPTITAETFTSRWGTMIWGVDDWGGGGVQTKGEWATVGGIGYCASIRLVVDVIHPYNDRSARWGRGRWGVGRWGRITDADEIELTVNAFDTTYQVGAFI